MKSSYIVVLAAMTLFGAVILHDMWREDRIAAAMAEADQKGQIEAAAQPAPHVFYTLEVTAYCESGNHTATGTWPKLGTLAADWNLFPPGTKLYVPGYGIGTVEDSGGAIKGPKLDVFMPTYDAAVKWGRQKGLQVQVISWGGRG